MGEYPALDISWALRPDDEHVERLLAEVDGHHPTAVEERANGIRIFFATAADRGRAAVHLIAADPSVDCAPVDVPDEDWAARSQAMLEPIRVGELEIVPVFDGSTPPVSRLTPSVFIHPSMGFGTGHHASTRLCLTLLQRGDVSGARVLDVGTGSGVLAIAAWRLGATEIIAIDVDEDAVGSACENVALNRAGSAIAVYAQGIDEFRSNTPAFDFVLANLTGATLIRFARSLAGWLAPSGRLIASGILDAEARDVIHVFEALGCRVIERASEDEWIGVSLTSPTSSTA